MQTSVTYQLPYNTNEKEIIYLLKSTNRTSLSLSSNFPYELWINNKFVASGGYRCTDTDIYIDTWPNLSPNDNITIRYQWLNSNTCNVWHRRIFPVAVFVDMISFYPWTLSIDPSIKFGDKICAQLPHQNIISASTENKIITMNTLDKCPYVIKPLPVHPCEYIDVIPKLISQKRLSSVHPNFKTITSSLWSQDMKFKYDTYDLGYIALHRFEADTKDHGIVLYYGEVSKLEDLLTPSNRKKVKLADAISKYVNCGAPFGTRGCRYVNVIYPINSKYTSQLRVQRYQYPFTWSNIKISPKCENIVNACKNNLIACVDGGVVDTCWRERAQWTGDARISLMALKYLTTNTEVIEFVLDQISQSYDDYTGMVQGAYPIKKPGRDCEMPTYHLAFCYAVIEHYGRDIKLQNTRAYNVMISSLNIWKQKYLKNNIINGVPGWYFLDWDNSSELVSDWKRTGVKQPHSVCNAMYYDICNILKIDSGININIFNELFCWKSHAYTINSGNEPNLHATAIILSLESFINTSIGVEYMINVIDNDFNMIRNRVTAYYAYFIAKALQRHVPERVIPFIKKYYDPIADVYGTIYEKTNANSSMAHGWSIGIASLIVDL